MFKVSSLIPEATSCPAAAYPACWNRWFPSCLCCCCCLGGDTVEQHQGNRSIVSSASILQEPRDINMQRFTSPLLCHIIRRGCFGAASKRQCLQYLRVLRTLQHNGFNTVFLGETDIPESLVTGGKTAMETSLRWPVWTLVHAASHQGWVPWRYKLLLRVDLPTHQQTGIFQELCESLTTYCGKCVIVTRDKTQPMLVGAKEGKEQQMGTLPPVTPASCMSSIECCHEAARAHGHELLVVPSCYNYLYPMDVAWSSLKWFILNNREDFALRSSESTYSYRCLLFGDLIANGIEKMTPNKWKMVINRVKRWENYYLDTLS